MIFDGLNIDGNDITGYAIGTANAKYLRFQNMEVKNTPETALSINGEYGEFLHIHCHHNGLQPATAVGAHCYYVSGCITLSATIKSTTITVMGFSSVTRSGLSATTLYSSRRFTTTGA